MGVEFKWQLGVNRGWILYRGIVVIHRVRGIRNTNKLLKLYLTMGKGIWVQITYCDVKIYKTIVWKQIFNTKYSLFVLEIV